MTNTTSNKPSNREGTETEMPSGFQRTDAGNIPIEWRVLQLRDVCTLINGRGFKPYEWRDAASGLPIIRIQNLNGSDDFNYYDGAFHPKILVEDGQLLFAWSGSRGTSFGPHIWHGSRGVLNYHTWKVVPNDRYVDACFLLHALRHLTAYIEEKAHGASALVHTQKWEMEGLHLALPPLPEQRAIAAALSDVDALIGALDAAVAKKRAIKLAAMQQLLTGKTRLPGFRGEWVTQRIGDVLTVRHGRSQRDMAVPHGRYPILASGGEIGRTDTPLYEKPSVLIGRKGTIDDPQFASSPFWTVDTLFYTEITEGTCAKFMFYKFCIIPWRNYNEASGVPSLNARTIEGIDVILPQEPEQTAIADVLSDMDAEIAALEQRRDKTRAIKQGMMQALLTGRVRLVEPEAT
jgi:type I restriction enzyme, S subunit